MKPISIQDDIIPIGELKGHAARVMRKLRDTGRPTVITQNGRPSAVLITPADFDRLTYRERFIAAVEEGLADGDAGRVISDDELGAELVALYGPDES